MENVLPTVKQTGSIEKPKQTAFNIFNEGNPYDKSKATTLNDDNKVTDYISGLKKSIGEERGEQLAFNRYNKNNEYKPTD